MLTLQQRVYLVQCYGLGSVSYRHVIEEFNNKYPGVHVTRNAVAKLVKKFEKTGSVANIKQEKKSYRYDDDAASALALNSVEEHPKQSLRRRSLQLGICKSLIQQIYKANKIHPYKPTFIHTLKEGDYALRQEFCSLIGEKIMDDPSFCNKILFSDEATFTTNGVVSSQNCRFWARENPNFKIMKKSQEYKTVNVWCGILPDRIIGPFFLDENLNQEVYLNLLENHLLPALEEIPANRRRNMFFQQDGCTPHSTLLIRGWLDENFPNRWIGRYSELPWPARSPDLTPLDFFLWGYLKEHVYAEDLHHNVDFLKNKITTCINEITPDMLRNVYRGFRRRIEDCFNNGGGHVE